MQYKIPLQIENEDEIVLWLSLRQLIIMACYFGVAYVIFDKTHTTIGDTLAIVLAAPIVIIGIVIALMRVYEMTFLPTILNFLRLSLNGRERKWVQWVDSYSDLDIWYITSISTVAKTVSSKESFDSMISSNEEFEQQLKNI